LKVIGSFEKHDFKIDQVLLNIAVVYTNLKDNVEFQKSVIKDRRCFKLEYFTTLINKIN